MSLFGKILLVINLLAAGGFVYFATQDWKGRQTITAAGLRHQLILVGLPLDGPADFPPSGETPFHHEGAGGIPTETVSKKLLDSYFQGLGGGSDPNSLAANTAVPNQAAEVQRVKRKVEEILSRTDGTADKINLLRGWLIYQVETFSERVDVLLLSAADRLDAESGKPRGKTPEELGKDAEELQRRLMARIDGAASAAKTLDPAASTALKDDDLAAAGTDEERNKILQERAAKIGESRLAGLDEDERRRKIAHLLVHLSPEAAWQKRVLGVIGVRSYIKAIQTQSRRFEEMSLQLEQLLLADQEAYFAELKGRPESGDSPEHRGLIKEAQEKTLIANRMAAIKAKWVEQFTKDTDLVKQRETQLNELKNQLAKVKGQVDVMLSRQSTIESGLFEIQREVAVTLDEVYKFEAELAERERKLAGGK
jgi:hypothetical protein